MNRWSYNEMKLDVNFGRDAFYAEFGHGATFPQVIIGGQKVGGCTDAVKYLREAYGHIPKPEARKIRKYLYKILEDAWTYEKERRPGRKRAK